MAPGRSDRNSCRVWKKGEGPKLGFIAGFGGLPRWIPFLDGLARQRTVIVPSLPGFPGGDRGHTVLDSHLDWVLAVRQLVRKAGLDGAAHAADPAAGHRIERERELVVAGEHGGVAAERDRELAVRDVRLRLELSRPRGAEPACDPVPDEAPVALDRQVAVQFRELAGTRGGHRNGL